jgi:hypothetical protein
MLMEKRVERDRRGNPIREYMVPKLNPDYQIDSWFLCIAPLERPQLAIAVIIEAGGFGAKAAAPVAAALVLKARDLGLLNVGGVAPAQAQPGRPQTPAPAQPLQPRTTPSPRTTPTPRSTPAARPRDTPKANQNGQR